MIDGVFRGLQELSGLHQYLPSIFPQPHVGPELFVAVTPLAIGEYFLLALRLAAQRQAIGLAVTKFRISERRSCELLGYGREVRHFKRPAGRSSAIRRCGRET
jgi:hypothetical protein